MQSITQNALNEKIEKNQKWLLAVSRKIKNSIKEGGKDNSISEWITKSLIHSEEILKAFDLQHDQKIREALFALIENSSKYRGPILKMLIHRVLIYIHSTADLKKYANGNKALKEMVTNLNPLLLMTNRYAAEYLETLTIDNVYNSVNNASLREHVLYLGETDIQIVLKAIKSDGNREIKEEKLQKLLDFLFERLKSNMQVRGAIANSRHAWWSLKDQLLYREKQWLSRNKDDLRKILEKLMQYNIYLSHGNSQIVDPLETVTKYYERVWVLENAMEIMTLMTKTDQLLSESNMRNLKAFILTEIDQHLKSDARINHLRNIQCDLVLLYHIQEKYDLIYPITKQKKYKESASGDLTEKDLIDQAKKITSKTNDDR